MNVQVNGIKCCTLIDTRARCSYASAKLIDHLKIKPIDVKVTQVDMLLETSVSRLEKFTSLALNQFRDFKMDVIIIILIIAAFI